VVAGTRPAADCRDGKENTMVTPKVNETKRGSAHKVGAAGTPASAQPPQR